MEEKRRARWRKLDNAAQAFPAATDKKDTRVFRFYCQLCELVDAGLLQEALDKTVEKYPVFQAVLRKGLFWFYLEHRDLRALAAPEEKKPCSRIMCRMPSGFCLKSPIIKTGSTWKFFMR